MLKILEKLKQDDNYRTLRCFKHNGKYILDKNKQLINLASNDYLGIAAQGTMQKFFLKQHKTINFSSSSSRSLSGGWEEFFIFEDYLSKLYSNKALIFNSGYALNLGIISALAKIDNVLFLVDHNIHASIIDGLILGKAKFFRYKHLDIQNLESKLQQNHDKYDKIIILTEALFSMDGDFSNIEKLIQLKKKFKNILLYVDEAHSIGSIGINGLGLCYKFKKDIDFIVLTFGKSIASIGAAVICNKNYKEYFINKARSLIYSTAIPPINVAFTQFIFENLPNFQTQRDKLVQISRLFDNNLKNNCKIVGESYIKMVVIGDNNKSTKLSQYLYEKGYYAPAIKHPTVAKNCCGIRFSLNALLTNNEIDNLCNDIIDFQRA